MKIKSPINLSESIDVLESIASEQIIALYDKFGLNVRSQFKNISEVFVCQCKQSKLKFYAPAQIAGDAAFYEALEKKYEQYYSNWKWEHEQLIPYLPKAGKVLEIGCAHGSFLEKIQTLGVSEATGLELNPNAVARAQTKGLQVYNHLIDTHLQTHANHYDLICSFQVVEHIAELKDFFTDSIACLKQGGLYAISVPNNECYLFSNDPDNTLNLPPHHMNLWDEQSLRNIAPMFGLSVLAVHKDPAYKLNLGNYYEVFLRNTLKLKGKTLKVFYKITRPIVKLAMRLVPPKYGVCIIVIYQKQ
jgi:2-polyprenyl-3-methyl-5-hydroxy-6-metoxy-1,4-benzoquinol methylase